MSSLPHPSLRKRPDDEELVAEIFRAVHTIKAGRRAFWDLAGERLAHAGESCWVRCAITGLACVRIDQRVLELMDGAARNSAYH